LFCEGIKAEEYCKKLKENKTNEIITFIWNEFIVQKEITDQSELQFAYLVFQ
jgi:hypothetical protein